MLDCSSNRSVLLPDLILLKTNGADVRLKTNEVLEPWEIPEYLIFFIFPCKSGRGGIREVLSTQKMKACCCQGLGLFYIHLW